MRAKIRGETALSTEEMLLAIIADKLSMLVWMQSEDGRKNVNRPRSIYEAITGKAEQEELETFNTPEEFEAERARLLSGGGEKS